jgi:hypothetical protein
MGVERRKEKGLERTKGKGNGDKDRLRVCREGGKGRKALSWRERASRLLILAVISQYRVAVAWMAFWQQAGGQRGGG